MSLSVRRPEGRPRRRVSWDDAKIQREVVSFILREMKEDGASEAVAAGCRGRRSTDLERVLKQAKQKFLPRTSTRTLRHWFHFFMMYGFTPADGQKADFSELSHTKYPRRGGRGHWTEAHTRKLKEILDNAPDMYLDEIQDIFCSDTRTYWSASFLWERLHNDAGYTLKDAVTKARRLDNEERGQYLRYIYECVFDPSQFIYVDETAWGRNASRHRRRHHRSLWTTFRDEHLDGDPDMRYSMIAACDIDGFVWQACDITQRGRGHDERDQSEWTIEKDRFKAWVQDRLLPVLGNFSYLEKRSIVVMDNECVRFSNEVEALIEGKGALLVYLPPDAPDLNPIAPMFKCYRSYLERHRGERDCWAQAHLDAIFSVDGETARECFRDCHVPKYEMVIEKEKEELQHALEMAMAAFVVAAAGLVVASSR